MTDYQVVAEMAAHIEVPELGGTSVQSLYKGDRVPASLPQWRIDDLLAKGVITEVGEVPLAPNAAVVQDPTRGLDSVTTDALRGEAPPNPTESGGETPPEVVDEAAEAKRVEARKKLADLGGVPDGRSSDAVLIEFLVANGYDRETTEKSDRAQLKELVASVTK